MRVSNPASWVTVNGAGAARAADGAPSCCRSSSAVAAILCTGAHPISGGLKARPFVATARVAARGSGRSNRNDVRTLNGHHAIDEHHKPSQGHEPKSIPRIVLCCSKS